MSKDLLGITTKARQMASKAGLSVVDLACADLMSCGWSLADVWAVCVRTGYTWPKSSLRKAQEEMVEAPEFVERLNSMKSRLAGVSDDTSVRSDVSKDTSLMDATSKEALIRSLLVSRNSFSVGSKEYIDATMKIADLTNAKREENKSEVELIHYHLPLKCSMCSLKRAHDEGLKK